MCDMNIGVCVSLERKPSMYTIRCMWAESFSGSGTSCLMPLPPQVWRESPLHQWPILVSLAVHEHLLCLLRRAGLLSTRALRAPCCRPRVGNHTIQTHLVFLRFAGTAFCTNWRFYGTPVSRKSISAIFPKGLDDS